jgi:uncharacterized protein
MHHIAAAIALAAAAPPAGEELTAPGPEGLLRGTLVRAAPPSASVALILPGSGPTDRDGNSPLGVAGASYRLLAEGLAGEGVSSVRIDKRGMFGSAAAVADANAVTLGDYVADVRAWVAAAVAATGAPCVWLIGHSEGGLVALAAADAGVEQVCGLVLVAAPGRPLGDVLRAQLRANPANAPLLDQAFGAIDRLERGERVDASGLHPALMPLFAPPVQGFLISLFAADPARLLAGYSGPVLIVQGEEDLQVTAEDAARLAGARSDAQRLLLPGVNHVLKEVPAGDTAANLAAYRDPNRPLAPGLAAAIADFLKRR